MRPPVLREESLHPPLWCPLPLAPITSRESRDGAHYNSLMSPASPPAEASPELGDSGWSGVLPAESPSFLSASAWSTTPPSPIPLRQRRCSGHDRATPLPLPLLSTPLCPPLFAHMSIATAHSSASSTSGCRAAPHNNPNAAPGADDTLSASARDGLWAPHYGLPTFSCRSSQPPSPRSSAGAFSPLLPTLHLPRSPTPTFDFPSPLPTSRTLHGRPVPQLRLAQRQPGSVPRRPATAKADRAAPATGISAMPGSPPPASQGGGMGGSSGSGGGHTVSQLRSLQRFLEESSRETRQRDGSSRGSSLSSVAGSTCAMTASSDGWPAPATISSDVSSLSRWKPLAQLSLLVFMVVLAVLAVALVSVTDARRHLCDSIACSRTLLDVVLHFLSHAPIAGMAPTFILYLFPPLTSPIHGEVTAASGEKEENSAKNDRGLCTRHHYSSDTLRHLRAQLSRRGGRESRSASGLLGTTVVPDRDAVSLSLSGSLAQARGTPCCSSGGSIDVADGASSDNNSSNSCTSGQQTCSSQPPTSRWRELVRRGSLSASLAVIDASPPAALLHNSSAPVRVNALPQRLPVLVESATASSTSVYVNTTVEPWLCGTWWMLVAARCGLSVFLDTLTRPSAKQFRVLLVEQLMGLLAIAVPIVVYGYRCNSSSGNGRALLPLLTAECVSLDAAARLLFALPAVAASTIACSHTSALAGISHVVATLVQLFTIQYSRYGNAPAVLLIPFTSVVAIITGMLLCAPYAEVHTALLALVMARGAAKAVAIPCLAGCRHARAWLAKNCWTLSATQPPLTPKTKTDKDTMNTTQSFNDCVRRDQMALFTAAHELWGASVLSVAAAAAAVLLTLLMDVPWQLTCSTEKDGSLPLRWGTLIVVVVVHAPTLEAVQTASFVRDRWRQRRCMPAGAAATATPCPAPRADSCGEGQQTTRRRERDRSPSQQASAAPQAFQNGTRNASQCAADLLPWAAWLLGVISVAAALVADPVLAALCQTSLRLQ